VIPLGAITCDGDHYNVVVIIDSFYTYFRRSHTCCELHCGAS